MYENKIPKTMLGETAKTKGPQMSKNIEDDNRINQHVVKQNPVCCVGGTAGGPPYGFCGRISKQKTEFLSGDLQQSEVL